MAASSHATPVYYLWIAHTGLLATRTHASEMNRNYEGTSIFKELNFNGQRRRLISLIVVVLNLNARHTIMT